MKIMKFVFFLQIAWFNSLRYASEDVASICNISFRETCCPGFSSSNDASLAPRKIVTSRVVSSGPASAMMPAAPGWCGAMASCQHHQLAEPSITFLAKWCYILVGLLHFFGWCWNPQLSKLNCDKVNQARKPLQCIISTCGHLRGHFVFSLLALLPLTPLWNSPPPWCRNISKHQRVL